MEVLSFKSNAWWTKNLNIAPSLIPARWKKGAFPSLEHFIEICAIVNVSADWLFFGIGEKTIGEINPNLDFDKINDLHTKIWELENVNDDLKIENQNLKNLIQEMIDIYLASDKGKQLFERIRNDKK